MSDGVKFIFKTLLKVPIMVMALYFIFNMFFFFFIYFKLLGISYVVMQTGVENNYLPQRELLTLCQYAYEIERIPFVGNVEGEDQGFNDGGRGGFSQFNWRNRLHYPQCAIVIGQQNGADDVNHMRGVAIAYLDQGDMNTIRYGHVSDGNYELNQSHENALTSIELTEDDDAVLRKQYGSNITIGIACKYHPIWPIPYRDTLNTNVTGWQGVIGRDDTEVYILEQDTLNTERTERAQHGLSGRAYDIVLTYTVPGLHYYPDLIQN